MDTHLRSVRSSDGLLPMLTGGALVAYGLTQRTPIATALAIVGGGLVLAGARKNAGSPGIQAGPEGRGIEVTKSITIQAPVNELFAFWRRFENLPHAMRHVESVEETGPRMSRWVVKGPFGRISWDAELAADIPNRLIVWRSIPGSSVDHEGSVEFASATGGRGTVVKVSLRYNPPAGSLGRAVAALLGEEPSLQIAEDLRRLRQLIETGEITTTDGQPSGRM